MSSLKNSKMLFVRKLLGSDLIAVYKWSLLRHLICAVSLFKKAGEARRSGKISCSDHLILGRVLQTLTCIDISTI